MRASAVPANFAEPVIASAQATMEPGLVSPAQAAVSFISRLKIRRTAVSEVILASTVSNRRFVAVSSARVEASSARISDRAAACAGSPIFFSMSLR